MPLLFLTLGLPIATAVLLLLFRSSMTRHTPRWIALAGTVATLLLSLLLADQYRSRSDVVPLPPRDAPRPIAPQVESVYSWLTVGDPLAGDAVSWQMHFGLDGISVAMIVLSTVLTVSCVLISWEAIREREAEFYAALLILEAGLVGVFCSFDVVMFYVFFEFTLLPLFFLIAIWGGPDRRFAAVKFFLYTLAGSLITLVGLVALVLTAAQAGVSSPTSLPALASWMAGGPLPLSVEVALFAALSAGFLIKVPVFPFHTWLPLAHVEAPTAGSVLLAGVLLKLGTYGFLRIGLGCLPHAAVSVGLPVIGGLAVVGIIYGSLCALVQRDIKKLVAYSSVAHLGFCMLGLFALNVEGITGGVLQMINHGLSTGALFLLVGMIYDRYHTRQLDDLGGLAARLPLIACGMVFIAMASIGLPGLNGFLGEVLSLAGMFKRYPLYGVLGASGVVLGAWYLLRMVQFAFFGPLKEPALDHGHAASQPHAHDDTDHQAASDHGHAHGAVPALPDNGIRDMNWREALALGPIAALCLWIGVYPRPLTELIRPDVEALATLYPDEPAPSVALSPAAIHHLTENHETGRTD